MNRIVQRFAFAVPLLLLLLACGDGDGDPAPVPTATAEATETPVPSATPEPTATAEPTATPEPTAPSVAHPEGTRTGVPEVNEFLEIHEAGDAAAMAELLIHRDHPCLPPETAGYQVACPEGVEEGSPVSAFILSACHGGWVGEAGSSDLAEEIGQRDFLVHSVVAVQGHFATADGNDARDIVLVVLTPDQVHASAYHFAEGGGLVTVAYGCGHSVTDMLRQYGYGEGEVLFAAP